MCNGVCAFCAHEGETGTDELAQVLTRKILRMSLHSVTSSSWTCWMWQSEGTFLKSVMMWGANTWCGVLTYDMGCQQLWCRVPICDVGCQCVIWGANIWCGVPMLDVGCQHVMCECQHVMWSANMWCGVPACDVGCQHVIWSANMWCGVPTCDVGCQRVMWGASMSCGVPTCDVGCQHVIWGANLSCGVPTYHVGCQRVMWECQHVMWGANMWYGVPTCDVGFHHVIWNASMWCWVPVCDIGCQCVMRGASFGLAFSFLLLYLLLLLDPFTVGTDIPLIRADNRWVDKCRVIHQHLGVDKYRMTYLHLWLMAGIDNRIHICLLIAVVLCVCVVQIWQKNHMKPADENVCTLFTFSGHQANMHIVYIFRPTCTLLTFSGQHAHCWHFQANMHIVDIFRPLCLFGSVPLCSNTDRRTTWMWCGVWL